jgi:hypothetical protein
MKYWAFFIIVVAIALPGCDMPTYQSPPSGQATCSITVQDPGRFAHKIIITSIDQVGTEPHGGLFGMPPSTFRISPGHHAFSVRYTLVARMGYATIETEFEPNHSYTLYSDTDGNRFTAWFVDDANGKRIEQKESTDWTKVILGSSAEPP